MSLILSNFSLRIHTLALALLLLGTAVSPAIYAAGQESKAGVAEVKKAAGESTEAVYESDLPSQGVFARAWQSGFVVFLVLLILISLSIVSWAIGIAKIIYLRKIDKTGQGFVRTFWDSKSLNDLNGRLNEFPYSPVKEVFRCGYAELVRGTHLRDGSGTQNSVVINAAIDNLTRSLSKAKYFEKRRMERLLSVLAISASASPFIGLFGTVWGIMTAFESIARSGSASLAAVAPGISEALIATAFGLAAAIPAVIGYNMAGNRIRGLMVQMDGFSADFLNIVERYLVTDKSSRTNPNAVAASASSDQL